VKQPTALFPAIAGLSPGRGKNSGVGPYVLLRVCKTLALMALR
jgi:hypothetical protein